MCDEALIGTYWVIHILGTKYIGHLTSICEYDKDCYMWLAYNNEGPTSHERVHHSWFQPLQQYSTHPRPADPVEWSLAVMKERYESN